MSDDPLWRAAYDGNVPALEEILAENLFAGYGAGQVDMRIELAMRRGHFAFAGRMLDERVYEPEPLSPRLVLSAARLGPPALAARMFDLRDDIVNLRVGRRTPLHAAAAGNQAGIVAMLLERGADVDEYLEWSPGTPLHSAASRNAADAARVLLNAGAELEALNRDGLTALALADMDGHDSVMAVLLQYGAHPGTRELHGRSALHRAATSGTLSDVRAALALGGDPNARDRWGQTPLHLAASRNRPGIVRTLIDEGTDVNAQDDLGNTPLLESLGQSSRATRATVQMLLQPPADLDHRGTAGWSSLHALVYHGDPGLLALAIASGASLELRNDRGETPLLTAASYVHAACLRVLANAGADVTARDGRGLSAAELLVENLDKAHADREIAAAIRALAESQPDDQPRSAST